jgi:putative ABC transport system ATP-binding protein
MTTEMPETTSAIATDNLLQCRHVAKSFATKTGRLQILRDVTFDAPRGQVTVITGKSGMGKSTLLGLLGGLDAPDSGHIQVGEHELTRMTPAQLARLRRADVGIIFQSFNLLPSWTAFENVEAALLHADLTPAARAQQVTAMLASLGLAERQDHLPAMLSVGQQQRVAIARTLIKTPSLILADEPTGDVDPETAADILALLLAPVREHGATLVITTHGNFPLDVANRVYRLQDGIVEAVA